MLGHVLWPYSVPVLFRAPAISGVLQTGRTLLNLVGCVMLETCTGQPWNLNMSLSTGFQAVVRTATQADWGLCAAAAV